MYIEKDCIIEHEGRKFESGGAVIANGQAILYAYEKDKAVGTWHGDKKYPAYYGHEWRSCFGDKRQSVYFSIDNVKYYGVYYKSGSDIVRARAIKS